MDHEGGSGTNSSGHAAGNCEVSEEGKARNSQNRRKHFGQAVRGRNISARSRWEAGFAMSEVEEIQRLLAKCSIKQRKEVFDSLRATIEIHPFEAAINAKAEIILEALARAPNLTLIGIRGIIGEATFAIEVAGQLEGWRDVTPTGNHSYDTALADAAGTVRVQVKMQRREKFMPLIRGGAGIVEVQRTRGGRRAGVLTRPYHFGEFDILAVCMEPSHGRWNSFLYISERWLLPRPEDSKLVKIMQPVPLVPDPIWTDDFNEAVRRLREGNLRPDAQTPVTARSFGSNRARKRFKKPR